MDAPNPLSPGVLIYNGRPYAVGLLWLTAQEETAGKLLAERLKGTKADFYCNRLHISQQQGFGTLTQGHRRGMPVAAAMVADQLVGEWHGVFEAENGWWYVQVRSDTIMPYGDRFFHQEEDAYNVFQEEMAKHNWPHAYAPAKWRLGDAVARELPLKNLLDDLTTTTLVGANMAAVFGGTKQRNVGLFGLGSAAIVMGGLMLQTIFATPELDVPVNPNYVPRPITPVLEAPKFDGAEVVLPRQMAQQCGDAAAKLLISLPGWRAQKFTCGLTAGASMEWQKGSGSINDAKLIGQRQWPTGTAMTIKQSVLTASLTLDKLPTVQQEKLLPQEEALLILEQELQPMGALQIKPVLPPAPPPVRPVYGSAVPPPPPPPAPLPFLEVQFVSGFSPKEFVNIVSHPGVEFQSMEWNILTGVWQYGLKWIHARPAPPAPPPVPAATPASSVPSPAPAVAVPPAAAVPTPVSPSVPATPGATP